MRSVAHRRLQSKGYILNATPAAHEVFGTLLVLALALGSTGQVVPGRDAHASETMVERGEFALTLEMALGAEEGDSTEVFGRIIDIAVDAQNNIYVVDLGFQRVVEFSEAGEFIRTIGRRGPGPGEYDRPLAIDVDHTGNVVIADYNNIHLYSPDGATMRTFPHESGGRPILSIEFAPDGTIFTTWFDVWSQKIIHQYSSLGERLTSFCESYAAGEDVDVLEEQSLAGGTADIHANGLILYAQRYPFELRLFEADGELRSRITGGRRELDEDAVFENSGDSYRCFLPTLSCGALFMPDGSILATNLNTNIDDPESTRTIIELFDEGGVFRASDIEDGHRFIMCTDVRGRLYGYVYEPFPQLHCYSIEPAIE